MCAYIIIEIAENSSNHYSISLYNWDNMQACMKKMSQEFMYKGIIKQFPTHALSLKAKETIHQMILTNKCKIRQWINNLKLKMIGLH